MKRREFRADGLGYGESFGFDQQFPAQCGRRIAQPNATTVLDEELILAVGNDQPFVSDTFHHHVFSLAGKPITLRNANVSDGPQGELRPSPNETQWQSSSIENVGLLRR